MVSGLLAIDSRTAFALWGLTTSIMGPGDIGVGVEFHYTVNSGY